MKKILITGANGFVGKELTALLKSEDYFVLTTDLKGEVDLIGDLSDSSFVKIFLSKRSAFTTFTLFWFCQEVRSFLERNDI